jgi:hypothetical protein
MKPDSYHYYAHEGQIGDDWDDINDDLLVQSKVLDIESVFHISEAEVATAMGKIRVQA